MANEADALDRLYEAPPAEFTAMRKELARELKAAGQPERAAEVAALRKPTVAVWVVNQLARRHRRDVDLLLDAGHRLRAAQAEPDPEQAREAFQVAREAERDALQRLRRAAGELLQEEQGKASEAMVERALSTLRAAAVTEEGRELLARGRLTEEIELTGFDLAATLVAPRRPSRGTGKKSAVESARGDLQRAKEHEREASRRVREAERRVAEARKQVAAAEANLEQARAEQDEAEQAVAAAEAALKRARK